MLNLMHFLFLSFLSCHECRPTGRTVLSQAAADPQTKSADLGLYATIVYTHYCYLVY